tara:strand:- start:3221 stop:6820 length:3600 start_codon:yes stop_codon:yes gene_type:complete
MSKNALPLLTGGLNEVTRSDIIDNTELQVCNNYEVTGDGVLSKRAGVEEFDTELNLLLDEEFWYIFKISEPYYPINIVKEDESYNQTNDFILFVFGSKQNQFVLHMFYKKTDGTWTNKINDNETLNSRISEQNITYTNESKLEFTVTNQQVIITDNVNVAHYVTVDSDGKVIASTLGIPAPKQSANVLINDMDGTFQSDNFTETITDMRLGDSGYVQVAYTVVSKIGEESNPSPLSDTVDMAFHQLDDDFNKNMFLSKITVSDLVLPDVSKSIAEELESFKIYIRITPFISGLDTSSIELTETFTINNKFDSNGNVLTSGTTGNTYTLKNEPEPGNIITYENDVAPKAKTAAFIGGINILGSLKSSTNFTHNMQFSTPISIVNNNTSNYVDAIVTIKMSEDKINADGNFSILNFFTVNDENEAYIKENKLPHMIFYDEDLTTPLQVYFAGAKKNYQDGEFTRQPNNTQGNEISTFGELSSNPVGSSNNFFIVYVKIPLLLAGNQKTIYFTWVNDTAVASGVESKYYLHNNKAHLQGLFQQPIQVVDQYENLTPDMFGGKYFENVSLWNGFSSEGVSNDTLIKLNFEQNDPLYEDEQYLNKANRNISSELTRGTSNIEFSFFRNPGNNGPEGSLIANTPQIHPHFTNILNDDIPVIGSRYLSVVEEDDNVLKLFNESDNTPTMEKFYIDFWMNIDKDMLDEGGSVRNFITIDRANANNISLRLDEYQTNINGKGLELLVGDISRGYFDINFNFNNVDTLNLFFCFSINDGTDFENGKASLFYYNLTENHADYNTYQFDEITFNRQQSSAIDNILLGKETGNDNSLDKFKLDNLELIRDRYLSASNNTDIAMVWNIVNQQPAFRSNIGKYYDVDTKNILYNGNISFRDSENLLDKEFKNMVRWSNINTNAFADLNFAQVKEPIIKIIGAPSFLQYQYQNTFLIFTRNNIHRFVLEGNASGWAGNSSSIIDEKTQYGLLAPESLVRVAEGLFWLSETGVVKWDSQGLVLISKNRVKTPIDENAIGFHSSLKNQYIIVSNNEAYVYHIDRDMWTKFTGNDINNIINTAILTGGTELDNVNLLLVGTNNTASDEKKIMKYPSGTSNDASSIKTKDMFFEKGVLKRVQLNYESANEVTFKSNVTKNKADGTEVVKTNTIANIENGKYRGVANSNSRGKSLNFEVENADKIESIIYDILLQGQVKQ